MQLRSRSGPADTALSPADAPPPDADSVAEPSLSETLRNVADRLAGH
jgi:hypothetical protein